MISGYFYNQEKDLKTIKKLLKLIVLSNILYFIYNIALNYKGNILTYIENTINVKNIIKLIIFNDTPIAGHLWYLNAYLYTIIFCSFNKNNLNKCYFMIVPLLVMDIILGKYSLLFIKKEIPNIMTRNFLFVGIPYFLLGYYIKEGYNYRKINNKVYILGTIIFSITSIIEKNILIYLNCDATREHFISTTFLAICIFKLCLEMRQMKENNILVKLGMKYSTYIYIIHVIILQIITKKIKDEILISIFTVVMSIGIAVIYKRIITYVKYKETQYKHQLN